MHCALTEVGVLFATATTHSGWGEVGKDGIIPFSSKIEGGHAFAIVAYDQKGFWIQNSWGKDWGKGGFCHMSYSDWLRNGTDAWVGRLGAPMVIELHTTKKGKSTWASASQEKANYQDLRPHALSLGNGGKLESGGMLGNSAQTIKTIFTEYFPGITKTWKKKRILLYAHGGLVPEKSALNRIADYRNFLLEKEIYPLFFVWHTGAWDSLKNILAEAIKSRRPEGFISSAKNFMLDRLDDALEPLMRPMGKALWDEMKENAVGASENNNGAQLVVEQLAELAQSEKIEIHIIAHSAGSIFMAPVVNLLKEKNIPVHSLNLWAPACTTDVFEKSYAPLIGNSIKKFSLFTLTDQAEQDDNCGGIYNKSLLYLVSKSFEERFRIPVFQNQGAKILGMEKFASQNNKLKALIKSKKAEWILSPNQESTKSNKSSTASKHGDFDDDANCFRSTVMRILETTGNVPEPKFSRSSVSMGEKRNKLLND